MMQSNYIVIMTSKEFHSPLVELLKKHIGDEITYIDVCPEVEVKEDFKTRQEFEWIKGREL